MKYISFSISPISTCCAYLSRAHSGRVYLAGLFLMLTACGPNGFQVVGVSNGTGIPGTVAESGVITPTIYFIPTIDPKISKCAASEMEWLQGMHGEKYVQLCKQDLDMCAMQGSCMVTVNGQMRRFNVMSKTPTGTHFADESSISCQFAYGVDDICVDAFYSVAADLSLYATGDVLYIPKIRGLKLPDGSTHSGYFIVRDEGSGIKGRGRFDFFTGFMRFSDPQNPFSNIRLGDENTHFPYYRIVGPLAETVLKSRGFPMNKLGEHPSH